MKKKQKKYRKLRRRCEARLKNSIFGVLKLIIKENLKSYNLDDILLLKRCNVQCAELCQSLNFKEIKLLRRLSFHIAKTKPLRSVLFYILLLYFDFVKMSKQKQKIKKHL